MQASTTSDSPSPRRRHTKTSIATLVALSALAAGAQALAPASASAMVAEAPGACLAVRTGAGLFEWRTSGGEPCTPTSEDYLRAANSGIGDRYNVTDLPGGRNAGLDLPDNRGAGGVPDRDGQHFGDGPWSRIPWGKLWGKGKKSVPPVSPGKKSVPPVSPGKKWGWKKMKRPPKEPLTPSTPSVAAKALKELKQRLSPECLKMLEAVEGEHISWMESGIRAHQLTEGKNKNLRSAYELIETMKNFHVKQSNAVDLFIRNCIDPKN